MVANLPTLDEAFDRLCATGEQYPDASDFVTDLGLTYHHPRRGEQPILIDRRALAATGMVYTHREDVWWALHGYEIRATVMIQARQLIEEHFGDESSLIFGLSGYSSVIPGVKYDIEGAAIKELYNALAGLKVRPSMVIDGAVREGCLGLNGVVAAMHDLPTLGCIPFRGLANVGVRTHMLLHGNSYPDREELVGTLPDVLCCVGGADGTLHECQFALENGCTVLLLALPHYGPSSLPGSYRSMPDLVEAERQGQLVVCRSIDEIAACMEQIVVTASAWRNWSRNVRFPHLERMLWPRT